MKSLYNLIILFTILSCSISCQREPNAYIESNSVYFQGEKILEGNEDTTYRECLFLKEQNEIVLIKDVWTKDTMMRVGGGEKRSDINMSGLYTYNVATCEVKQILSCAKLDKTIHGLIKRSDNSFYFQGYGLVSRSSAVVCKCLLSTHECIIISGGDLMDVIKKGKYKGSLLIRGTKRISSPCTPKVFYAHWLIDDDGNNLGICIMTSIMIFRNLKKQSMITIILNL